MTKSKNHPKVNMTFEAALKVAQHLANEENISYGIMKKLNGDFLPFVEKLGPIGEGKIIRSVLPE